MKFDSEKMAQKANISVNQKALQDNAQLTIDYRGSYQESAKVILERLLKAGLVPISMNKQVTSLEDIFMEVTR